MTNGVVIACCVVGILFSLIAAIGLLRMPDVYHRIQCATMLVTFGAVPVLLAVMIYEGVASQYGSRALIMTALLVIVAPATSHALGRSAYRTHVPLWRGAVRDDPAAEQQCGQQQENRP